MTAAAPWLALGERVLVECRGGALHLTCQDDPARVRIDSRWGEPCGEVPLSVQDCNFSGVRPWRVCLECGKRRIALLVDDVRVACRCSLGVKYRAQSMGP
jgi:hypothetical protein